MAIADEREPACAIGLESPEVLAAYDEDHFVVLGRSLSTYFERVSRLVNRGAIAPWRFNDDGAEVLGDLESVRDEPEP